MTPRLLARAARVTVATLLFAVQAEAGRTKEECIDAAEQAQPLRQQGKLRSAHDKLLVCSQAECPAFVRNDCSQWLADVESALPSIIVHATDPSGADVTGVRVLVDGVASTTPEGSDVPVDPGTHVLRFEHEGSPPVEQTVLARVGERRRVVTVTIGAAPARTASADKAPDAPPKASSTGGARALPIVLLAAGGVSLAVAAYFWVAGLGDRSTLSSSCAPAHSCSSSSVDSAHGKLIAGDVLGGVGLVLAGAGTWLYVSRPPPAPSAAAAAGAVVGWSGRF